MDKILSFVIPSYNVAKYLDKCLSSFLNEDVLDRLDVIIVNDGSSDDTVSEAEKFCSKYPDSFRLISQENKGHGGALNTGLAAAEGKFVKVIDADDWVVTENLTEFVKILENLDAQVVLTHHYTVNISTGEEKKWKSYPEKYGVPYSFRDIMSNWKSFDRSLTFHGITYNTEFYKTNCMMLSEHVFYEDHEYATVPCCVAEKIVPVDMFIYCYRIGDVTQSVSDVNQLNRISHTQAVLRRLIKEFPDREFTDDAQKNYYCMKAQGLFISFLMTELLVEKDRKKGRKAAEDMMNEFRNGLPETAELAAKQYKAFMMMNHLHITKSGWEKISRSKLYNKVRHNHSFD